MQTFAQRVLGGAVLTLEVVAGAFDRREDGLAQLLRRGDLGARAVVVVTREVLPLLRRGDAVDGGGRG